MYVSSAEFRPLIVFLCHSSGDKPLVRKLYQKLRADGFAPWLDEEDIVAGQKWKEEIPQAVRLADVVLVCISPQSLTKDGYVQQEIKFALDCADEKPEGTIFLIPVRLADCVRPRRLADWQSVDLFEEGGYDKLLRALRLRAVAVSAGESRKILVIDDDFSPTNYFLDELRRRSFNVVHCHDADAAPSKWKTWCPDAVVLDVIMPHGTSISAEDSKEGIYTGLILYRRLRKDFPDIPVILLTALPITSELASQVREDVRLRVVQKGKVPLRTLASLVETMLKPEGSAT